MNGVNGMLIGSKVVASIVNEVISNSLLSKFTWTGKTSKKNEKKLKLKGYSNVLDMVFGVVLAADKTYTRPQFEYDMTYKILKYAYLHAQPTTSNSTATLISTMSVSSSESTNNNNNIVCYDEYTRTNFD